MTKYNVAQVEILSKVLHHREACGKLFWKKRSVSLFSSTTSKAIQYRSMKAWNSRWAGREAFTYRNNEGYFCGAVMGKMLLAHRVIWAMHYGEWPNQIDHINHDKTDNRMKNLRSVTHRENHRNRKLPSTNKSGHIGVLWLDTMQKWQAQININRKNIYLGCFEDISDAIAVRDAANVEYGFHENHGTK